LETPAFFIPGSGEKLEEGVVCTIEPGIYHPHVGGFRDEDIYIVTRDGFEKIITPMTKLGQVS
jgi:Xaa-Pro aminopeptidase